MIHLGVSNNSGTPKWMVYKGKPYEQMDDLGGKNLYFWFNTHFLWDGLFSWANHPPPTTHQPIDRVLRRFPSCRWPLAFTTTAKSSTCITTSLIHHAQPAKLGFFHVFLGLNSHYFHIIGDGHQPNSRGLYTHYKDSLLKVG